MTAVVAPTTEQIPAPSGIADGGGAARSATAAPRARFPARPVAVRWPATERDRCEVSGLVAAASGLADSRIQANCRRGFPMLLDWLADQPGQTWQDRWILSGRVQTVALQPLRRASGPLLARGVGTRRAWS